MANTNSPDGDIQPDQAEAKLVLLKEPTPDQTEDRQVQTILPPKRSGFLGTVLGGVLAAGAGFGLAQYVPNGWPISDVSALQATLSTQAQEIADLKSALTVIASSSAIPDPGLLEQIAALQSEMTKLRSATGQSDVVAQLDALKARFAKIEMLPTDGSAASPAALAAQTAALEKIQADILQLKTTANTPGVATAAAVEAEARLKEAQFAASELKSEAEKIAKAADVRSAISRMQAALDSGASYASALQALGDIPAVLMENAQTGLPTLADLQLAFPPAARSALEAALRVNMGEGWADRVANFLRSQTGARSLTPQAGNDADAILSRAEAALATGDIPAALAEIATLPSEAQTAMAEWVALAAKRQSGLQAVAEISAAIGD